MEFIMRDPISDRIKRFVDAETFPIVERGRIGVGEFTISADRDLVWITRFDGEVIGCTREKFCSLVGEFWARCLTGG